MQYVELNAAEYKEMGISKTKMIKFYVFKILEQLLNTNIFIWPIIAMCVNVLFILKTFHTSLPSPRYLSTHIYKHDDIIANYINQHVTIRDEILHMFNLRIVTVFI